jgi:hypothetical protein
MKRILKKAVNLKEGQKECLHLAMNLITKFERIMCKFSIQGLEEFISIPEIALLLLNYLSNIKNRRYRLHYEGLKKLAEDSVAASLNTNDSNEILNPKNEVKVMKLLTNNAKF